MNVKPRSKFILVSVAVAVALALTGGLLLKTVQAGGWSGPGPMQMAPHGFGTHIKGAAWFRPPHLPRIVERDLRSNCDRLFYKLIGGRYEQIYLRCRYGSGTYDYSPDYRNLFNFYATLQMTATVGTDPDVCATDGSVVVGDGTTVYYCYTRDQHRQHRAAAAQPRGQRNWDRLQRRAVSVGPEASVSNVDLGYEISHTFTAASRAARRRHLDGLRERRRQRQRLGDCCGRCRCRRHGQDRVRDS